MVTWPPAHRQRRRLRRQYLRSVSGYYAMQASRSMPRSMSSSMSAIATRSTLSLTATSSSLGSMKRCANCCHSLHVLTISQEYSVSCTSLGISPTTVLTPVQQYSDPDISNPRHLQRVAAFDVSSDSTQYAIGHLDGSGYSIPAWQIPTSKNAQNPTLAPSPPSASSPPLSYCSLQASTLRSPSSLPISTPRHPPPLASHPHTRAL
jgi:hypothetical protein